MYGLHLNVGSNLWVKCGAEWGGVIKVDVWVWVQTKLSKLRNDTREGWTGGRVGRRRATFSRYWFLRFVLEIRSLWLRPVNGPLLCCLLTGLFWQWTNYNVFSSSVLFSLSIMQSLISSERKDVIACMTKLVFKDKASNHSLTFSKCGVRVWQQSF